MGDGSEILAVLIIGLFGYAVLLILVRAFWPNEAKYNDEPYGDATETPQMLRQTRRVNHERRKV